MAVARSVDFNDFFHVVIEFLLFRFFLSYYLLSCYHYPAPQTPQPFFDADFEGLASNAELYIFNQEDSQE